MTRAHEIEKRLNSAHKTKMAFLLEKMKNGYRKLKRGAFSKKNWFLFIFFKNKVKKA